MDRNIKKDNSHLRQLHNKKNKKPMSRQLFSQPSSIKKQQKHQSLLVSQQLQPYYKEITKQLHTYDDFSSKKNTQQQFEDMDLADYLNMNKSNSHRKMINSFKDSLNLMNRQSKNIDNDQTNIVTPGKVQNGLRDQLQTHTIDKQKQVTQLKILLKERDQKIQTLQNQLKKSKVKIIKSPTENVQQNQKQQMHFLMKNNQQLYQEILNNKDEIKKLKRYLVKSLEYAKQLQLQLNTLQEEKLQLKQANLQLLHEKQQIIKSSEQQIRLMKKMKMIWNNLRKNYGQKDQSQEINTNQNSRKHKTHARNNLDNINRTNTTVKKDRTNWQGRDHSAKRVRQVNSAFQLF